MIFLREINPLSAKLLRRIYRQSKHEQVRQRAQCLILASEGVKIKESIKIFQVSYKTIYNWFERWESKGIIGIYNKQGRGCKAKFSAAQKEQIKEWTKQEPRQLKQVAQKVKKEWDIETSTKTIKRAIKMLSMSWHRMRREVGGKPNPLEYKDKKAQLTELKRLEDSGKINLYYLDESGFSPFAFCPLWMARAGGVFSD